MTTRRPGQRRDPVFRGRYGDTVGLGHSIALIHRARGDVDDRTSEDIVEYWNRIRGDRTCSCGTVDVPHLETFASHEAVAHRLGVDDLDQLDAVLRAPEPDSGDDASRRLALEETGRLLGYALDLGVRLYDPEAVLLTGGVPYSDIVWQAVEETAEVHDSGRRSLVRTLQLSFDDTNKPIGLYGAARLAADTWIYPSFVGPADTRV